MIYEFNVVCDETNNSQKDIEEGRINADIYLTMDKATTKRLFDKRPAYKKITRKLSYEVWYWNKENGNMISKYFNSAKRAKRHANYIHNSNLMKPDDYVSMEKTFCYREHSPRHKWYYISEEPNNFVCVEKY